MGLRAATRVWRAECLRTGGTYSHADLRIIDRFAVRPAQSSGIWGSLTRWNLCAGRDLKASLIPIIKLVGSVTDTNNNLTASDYDPALGWQSNGSSKYLNTGYSPSEATGGLSCYLRTTQTSDTNGRELIGGQSASHSYRIAGNRDANGAASSGAVMGAWGGPGSTNSFSSTTGGAAAGYWHESRTSSTSVKLFFNGVEVNEKTTAVTPGAGANVYVMCLNNNGSTASFLTSGSRVSGYTVDSGMTASQAAQLFGIINGFQRVLARNVAVLMAATLSMAALTDSDVAGLSSSSIAALVG